MQIEIGSDSLKRASAVEYQGAKPRGMRTRTHNRHIALVPMFFEISPGLGPSGSECHMLPPFVPSIVGFATNAESKTSKIYFVPLA